MLEWNGVSLVDRSFEEVCSIMDRTGEAVDLLIEHATDFRMCDLLDEASPSNPGTTSGICSSGRKMADDTTVGLAPGNFHLLIFF